jgi:hypothetical protein
MVRLHFDKTLIGKKNGIRASIWVSNERSGLREREYVVSLHLVNKQ